MRPLFTIGLVLLGAQFGHAENSPAIEWHPDRPLSWDDFQAPVPGNADEERVAVTAASLTWSYEYEVEWSHNSCQFKIVKIDSAALFHPDSSWARRGHRTAAVLAHEQGHFDIAKIYIEKFAEESNSLVGPVHACRGRNERTATRNARSAVTALVDPIYEAIWQQYQSQQTLYDQQTRHGINTVTQMRWSEEIATSLQAADHP